MALDPDLIAEFLDAEKIVSADMKWFHPVNTDTAQCKLPVIVPVRPGFNAKLHLTTHVSRLPEKYGFSMLLGSIRIAGLDVNPGRGHTNFRTGVRETVVSTHWQTWPTMDHVEPDTRVMSHRRWLTSFLAKHRISFQGNYQMPPHYGGEQLRLF